MAKVSVMEIAGMIASKHGLSQQDAEAFVISFFDLINDGLHREKAVKVKGLGTFKVIDVRERESVNVNTGERVLIESHGKITFTADPVMRDLVNKPFAQFETVILNDGVELEDMSKTPPYDDSDLRENDMIESEIDNTESDDFDNQESLSVHVEVVTETNKLDTSGHMTFDDKCSTDAIDVNVEEGNNENAASSLPEENRHQCISETGHSALGAETEVYDAKTNTAKSIIKEENDSYPDGTCGHDDIHGFANVESNTSDIEVKEKFSTDSFSNEAIEQFVVSGRIDDTPETPIPEKTQHHSGMAWYYWMLILLFVAVASFVGGCYWEKNNVKPIIKYVTVKQPNTHTLAEVADTASKNMKVENSTENHVLEQKDSVSTKKNITEKQDNKLNEFISAAEVGTQDLRNAATAVKTGAYRIVGTDRVVTVKKGETLKKISKFYLGDGMECYIIVHNGTADIKEGMRLKIPKLVSKKK